MEREDSERLAIVKLAKTVAQFPFLADEINPLIIRLLTSGTVNEEVVTIAKEKGLVAAIKHFRRFYFNNYNLIDTRKKILIYLEDKGIVLDK